METRLSFQTDIGKKRAHNEDAVKIYENDFCKLMVVADGMGGHEAGDIASAMVINVLDAEFSNTTDFETAEHARVWIKAVLNKINTDILSYIEDNKITHGMGTTVIISIITKKFVCFGHVGDSRAYYYSNNRLRQVTKDHTFVRRLVEEGKLSEAQAKRHPHRNIIMNALGVNQELKFDFIVLERYNVDGILLCTDGLTTSVEDEQIITLLSQPTMTEYKVNQLINLANEYGGTDNISVALFECLEGSWT
ncbi:MAG TPA: Stp1/IreP family PP2C-type Ser/Thr phosphatase [Firmicutes bacterium]|nr:Stp1/IreP family PP2C-type Ser/Thr phosphatase [Bacillota bacterium]